MKRLLRYTIIFALGAVSFLNVSSNRDNSPLFTGGSFYVSPEMTSYVVKYFKMLDDAGIEYDRSQPIFVVFNNWEARGGVLGIAFGMYHDEYVNVHINKEAWAYFTPEEREMVIFHELSHDVFNLVHGSIELMRPSKPATIDKEFLKKVNKELIKHLKKMQNGK